MMPGLAREWGDGATSKRAHVIEDIKYSDDGSRIRCRCGAKLTGATPELLAVSWTAHGGSVMTSRDWSDRGPRARPEDRPQTMLSFSDGTTMGVVLGPEWEAIIDMGEACTCPETGVLGCPNYQKGDDESESEGDE